MEQTYFRSSGSKAEPGDGQARPEILYQDPLFNVSNNLLFGAEKVVCCGLLKLFFNGKLLPAVP